MTLGDYVLFHIFFSNISNANWCLAGTTYGKSQTALSSANRSNTSKIEKFLYKLHLSKYLLLKWKDSSADTILSSTHILKRCFHPK